jgi:prepilin-type N-terminal cleavage/methylation domain-containing protein
MRNERGVTLIEMILSIVLIGIIGVIASSVFLYSTRSVLTGNNVREATQVNRMAMDRMVREIRNVVDNTRVVAADATTFEFVNVDGNTVQFQLTGTDLNRVFTVPPNPPVTDLLAANVSASPFAYLNTTGGNIPAPAVAPAATDIWWVQITLSVGSGSDTVQFRSRVHPRSF